MMPYSQEAVDPLDLDEYFDFNQVGRSGSPASSAGSSNAKSVSVPEQTTPRPRQSLMKPANPPNVFAGPSHQYDMHKQQTGLPVGGLASTIAANRQAGFTMQQSFPSNNFGLQNPDEIFDFNAMPSNPPAFSGMVEMDVDFGSPVDGMPAPMDGSDFVDPHTLGGASSPPRETVRMYPGMHTQQAALAKQRQQQEIQRQQQMKPAAPAPQPSAPLAGHRRDSSQRSMGSAKGTDPVVEERISRLLNQMRNGSSSDNSTSPNSTQTHFPKAKKPEEDMDDDERLLASEEGKKLSSKERRQLRNKVSARAFRSRRKEYITQLEGEITSKTQEADDLRAENEALRSENMRLTDLSKMLLSSPAFSNFLNDLSANGMPGLPQAIANQQQQSLARQMQQQQQQQPAPKGQPPKDVNPHQSQLLLQQQQQQQVQSNNMNTIPENDMDFSNLDANGNWGVGMDFGFDAQVFQVTELPSEPLTETPVDTCLLSGKGCSPLESFDAESKLELPSVEAAPAPEPECQATLVVDDSVDFNESNPAYALFADDDKPLAPTKPVLDNAEPIFGAIPVDKALAHINLTVSSETDTAARDSEMSAADMARFTSLQAQLNELSARVASYLS